MTEQQDGLPTVVRAFRSGDEAALSAVYARWSPLVYSLALQSLEDVSRAEEVTRRVFTRAWAVPDGADVVGADLSSWLVGLARSEIGRTPDDLAGRLVVVDEVSHWATEPRQVLRMALHGELTHVQIAERLGLSAATVKAHLRRGLLALRERLEVQPHAC